jgi:hypothetical protein
MASDTTTPRKQRRDLRERRRIRQAKSAERQQALWAARFAAAENPLDLLGHAYALLRTRVVQWESRAVDAYERARTDQDKTEAADRLEGARADVERICGELAGVLVQAAEQLNTTRK